MKKIINILEIICVIALCAGMMLITRSIFIQNNGIDVQLTADSNQYVQDDTVKIILTATNNTDKDISNLVLEISMPECMQLTGSSPSTIRNWSELKSGESISAFTLSTITGKPEAAKDKTSGQSTMLTDIVDKSTSAAPIVIAAAVILLILIFIFKKEGRILLSVLLVAALVLGSVGTVAGDAAFKYIFSKSQQVETTVIIDGTETIISGSVTYNRRNSNTSEDNEYRVVFDTDISEAAACQSVKSGAFATEPVLPEQEGYIFAGWYTDEALSEKYSIDTTPVTGDVILYAKWVDEAYGWDSDGDGINDVDEKFYGSDPYEFDNTTLDSDSDGLADYLEVYVYKTNPNDIDTDKDLLSDYDEVFVTLTNPLMADTDSDGIDDYNEDTDGDGLVNGRELELGTNPLNKDTDGDGLGDFDEVTVTLTDPLVADTDGDGGSDGWETANGYNPLKNNPYFYVTSSAASAASDVTASVNLAYVGNPESVTVKETIVNGLLDENMPGYIGSAFSFSADNTFDKATISFSFDEAALSEDADPVIYYFNEETQLLEPLETIIENGTASTVVAHFSTYVLLNRKMIDEVWKNDVLAPGTNTNPDSVFDIAFVIDYSASMDTNDPEYTRLTIVDEFISKLRDDRDMATVIKFAAYATTLVPLTTDKTMLSNAALGITNVSSDGCDSEAGTNGSDGLYKAIEELKSSPSEDYKYIIFLTDGEDTTTSYDYDELISDALANNIIIFSIAMGDADEELLRKVAESTGGRYYFASAVDMEDTSEEGLMDAFYDIEISTIDFETDSNGDGISDYYTKMLCTGRLRTGTGVALFQGIDFDDVQASADYDGDGVINGEEVIISYDEATGKTYIMVVSSPISADTDDDGISDKDDTAPLKKGLAGGIIGKLYLVSCYDNEDSGWTSGHVFFVYTSYIKDELDFSGLVTGWSRIDDSQKWSSDNFKRDSAATDSYAVLPNESLSIGNGALGAEWFEMFDCTGSSTSSNSDANGVSYNMEVGKHFSSDYGYSYIHNTYISQNVTEAELSYLVDYCSLSCVSYWSLTHNCAEVACQAWNSIGDVYANPYDFGFMVGSVATPKGLKSYMRTLNSYGEDFNLDAAMGE